MADLKNLRGKFIVFDGNEGCGKSTQATLLARKLFDLGIPILHVRDPGSTRIGEQIRTTLLNPENTDMGMRCEMLLYMAARAQMMKEVLQPALAAGQTVISDRFVSSTLAYQLGGDGLTAKDIYAVADVAIEKHWPALTILLDMPVHKSSVRVDPQLSLPFPNSFRPRDDRDRIERRPLQYHLQVRKNYLRQAKDRHTKYRIINADQPIDVVHEDVWRAVLELARGRRKE